MSVVLLGHCMSAGSGMPCHAKSLHIQGLTMCVIRAARLYIAPANVATVVSMLNGDNHICLCQTQVRDKACPAHT